MADFTFDEVITALKNAEAEGRLDDARQLALIADGMMKGQQAQAEPEGPTFDSVMGQLNKEENTRQS